MIRMRERNNKWLYMAQEHILLPKKKIEVKKTLVQQDERKPQNRVNQFGRFQFNTKKYGLYDTNVGVSRFVPSDVPFRIKTADEQWIYTTYKKLSGENRRVRIRGNEGDWIYTAHLRSENKT